MAQLLRLIESGDVVCPAGDVAAAGTGVNCRIEDHVLTQGEGRSVAAFCLSHYEGCPTWRAEKEAQWKAHASAIEVSDREAAAARELPEGIEAVKPIQQVGR